MKKGKVIQIISIGFILAVVGSLNIVCFQNRKVLNNFAYVNQGSPNTESSLKGETLAKQIEGEGAVLLENNNSTLPLVRAAASKVNVFGWSSTQWVYSGSGSGRVTHIETDFIKAMEDYGIETNTDLTDYYTNFLSERPYMGKVQSGNVGTLKTYSSQFSVLYEPSFDSYPSDLLADAKDYSDTAIVVISRVGGESNDLPKYQRYCNTQGGRTIKEDKTRTYLDISQDEEDLLNYVTGAYAHTIVLINSTNAMNLSFLKDYRIGAALFTGATGESAASALPPIIYGETDPSGKLTDTFAYSFDSNPAYAVSGPTEKDTTHNYYSNTNVKGIYPNVSGVTNGNVSDSPTYPGCFFVDYREGIYLGYKWYETADAEGYFSTVDNQYGKGYEGVVEYPFGYGLSYTSFTTEIVSSSVTAGDNNYDDEIRLSVKVTNTGNVKGKKTVQLYLTKPYTLNGIEKSAVELADYGKTLELEPNANELVDLSVKLSDFADYDENDANKNGFSGYELEKGNYVFTVRDNSHNISSGDNTYTYKLSSDLRIENDPVSGEKIQNRLLADNDDGFAIDGSDSDQDITYLSRSDFRSTFPNEESAADRQLSTELISLNKSQYSSKYVNDFDLAHEDDYSSYPEFGSDDSDPIYEDGKVTDLGYELGADFSSSKWDSLLNTVSKAEAMNSTLHGYTHNEDISSIGKPYTREVDGPAQAGSFNVSSNGLGYPNATVLAQTFNSDLAYQFGKQLGTDAQANGFDGLYAFGINLHRTPFGGRNYEYLSEDSFLTGTMSANETKGCLNVGTYCYMKHFIGYEQETDRDGLYTWMSEQTLRQNYLKPFVMAIRKGGLNGIMTSYNRLGATWAGGNYSLIHELLEKEIGYKGSVITDYADHQTYMNQDQALRAGGSLWMDGYLNDGKFFYSTSSDVFLNSLKEATKRNVYTFLNTAYMNKQYKENGDGEFISVHKPTPYYWWTTVLYAIDGVTACGVGVWITLLIVRSKKIKVD